MMVVGDSGRHMVACEGGTNDFELVKKNEVKGRRVLLFMCSCLCGFVFAPLVSPRQKRLNFLDHVV